MKSICNVNFKNRSGHSGFTFLYFILIGLSISLNSCGDKNKNEEGIVAPQGMITLDLSKYGKPFAIFVPDTVTTKLQITEQASGALDIKVGHNFAISIFEQAADLELKKSDLKSDELNKLKNFVIEEPGALVWESELTQPEFHFLINIKVAGNDYSMQDIVDSEVNPFGKEVIQKMYESCKNIKEIQKTPKS